MVEVKGTVNYVATKVTKLNRTIVEMQIEQIPENGNGRPNHIDLQIWSDSKGFEDYKREGIKIGDKVVLICNIGVDKDAEGRYINRIRYFVNGIKVLNKNKP